MRTNIKGDIGELAVMQQFLKLGYWVSKPFGDDCPYDLIVDNKVGVLKRVQIKYTTPMPNKTLRIKFVSESGEPYKNTIDWICAYNPESGKCYLLDIAMFPQKTAIYLRLEPAKSNIQKGVTLAEHFELTRV